MSGIKQLKKRKDDSQSMATYINEFQKLINHMNRLFLYKAKNSYTIDRNKKLKYSRKRIKELQTELNQRYVGTTGIHSF